MTGTSSDVAFADAYVKGVRSFNAKDAYDAALKNATVAPPGPTRTTRTSAARDCRPSLFLGYTPTDVDEGVSWALEGDINDFGIANMAEAARRRSERRRCRAASATSEESEYFFERARNYVNMFDPAIGFFQGRAADGEWKSTPARVRPARVGPRARLHRDRRLELRLPRAAGRARPREPLRRPRRAWLRSSTRSSRRRRPRSTRARTAGSSTR